MDLLSKDEFLLQKKRRYAQIRKGALFVYPTDTIYGLGCDATDGKAVERIRELKERPKSPFSVITPSREWVQQNCEVSPLAEEWIAKLPGPYTLVLNLRNADCVAAGVLGEAKTLGIRMPQHWTTRIAEDTGKPIVTTSVNKSGREFLTGPAQLSAEFRDALAFCIDEGELQGAPSTIINLTGDAVEVVHRK